VDCKGKFSSQKVGPSGAQLPLNSRSPPQGLISQNYGGFAVRSLRNFDYKFNRTEPQIFRKMLPCTIYQTFSPTINFLNVTVVERHCIALFDFKSCISDP
jgi:hypothetical protein